jgi:hypothetical protein
MDDDTVLSLRKGNRTPREASAVGYPPGLGGA